MQAKGRMRLIICGEACMIALGFLFAACLTDTSGGIRADAFSMGNIEISVIEAKSITPMVFERSQEKPTYDLDPGIDFAGIRAIVNKTLGQVEAGEPPDSVALGLKVAMLGGHSCWLIAHTSPVENVIYKYSPILGDVFEVGVRKDGAALIPYSDLSIEFKDQDFLPALQEASRRMHSDLRISEVKIIGVYPFSKTILSNEGGIIVSAKVHDLAPISSYTLSSVALGGEGLSMESGAARLEKRPGVYEVEAVAIGRAIFFPAIISAKVTITIDPSGSLAVQRLIR